MARWHGFPGIPGSLLVLVVLLLLGGPGTARGQAARLSLTGSSSMLPLLQMAAERYMRRHPEAAISVAGWGSGVGVRAILDMTDDLAAVSRRLRPQEEAMARQRGIQVKLTPVALGCVLPVVARDNPVRDLSRVQLTKIYQGTIRNWREVGGPDLPIRRVEPGPQFGAASRCSGTGPGALPAVGRRPLPAQHRGLVQALAGNRAAIGYAGMSYLNRASRGWPSTGWHPPWPIYAAASTP